MSFDPISYNLAKSAKRSVSPVIPSDIEISEKNNLWFDTTTSNLKTYHFIKQKWAIIKKYVGYDGFDNNLENGVWTNYINIPISTPPTESIQYKIEISGNNINVYSNDGTTVLSTGTGALSFWSKVNVDGSDIRVFDESYNQNYFWIEEWDYANQIAIIWVKINAGQETLNIAFGNTDCLLSNYYDGKLTFELFDDFNGTTIDTNLWTVSEANGITATVNNSELVLSGTASNEYWVANAYIDTIQSFNSPFIVELYKTDFAFSGTGGSSRITLRDSSDTTNHNYEIIQDTTTSSVSNPSRIKVNPNIGMVVIEQTSEIFNPHKWTVIYNSGTIQWIIDGVSKDTTTYSITEPIYLRLFANARATGDTVTAKYDWIFVRKYLSTDLSFGALTIKEF